MILQKWTRASSLGDHRAMHRPFYLKNISCLSGTFKIGKELKNPNCQILNWSDFYKIDRLFIENLDSLQVYFLRPKSFCFLFHYFQLPKNGYVIFIFFNYCSQIAYQIENIKKVDMTHANFSRGRAKKLLAQ